LGKKKSSNGGVKHPFRGFEKKLKRSKIRSLKVIEGGRTWKNRGLDF